MLTEAQAIKQYEELQERAQVVLIYLKIDGDIFSFSADTDAIRLSRRFDLIRIPVEVDGALSVKRVKTLAEAETFITGLEMGYATAAEVCSVPPCPKCSPSSELEPEPREDSDF